MVQFIWLGHGHPDNELIMTVVQWLVRRILRAPVFEIPFSIPSQADLETECQDQFDISLQDLEWLYRTVRGETTIQDAMLYSHRIWTSWYHFASTEWFSRVWTLQELLLARQAIFVYGKKHVNWQSLQLMTKNSIDQRRQGQLHNDLLIPTVFSYINIRDLMLEKEGADNMIKKFKELRFSMAYLLFSGAERKLEATKLQDHVYGKLGLVPPEIQKSMPVDYTLSPESVLEKYLRISCFNDSDIGFSSTENIVNFWEIAPLGPPSKSAPSWLPLRLDQDFYYNNILSLTPFDHQRACEGLHQELLGHTRCRMFAEAVIELDVFHVDTVKIALPSPFTYPPGYFDEILQVSEDTMTRYSEILSEPVSTWLEKVEELLQTAAVNPLGQSAREMFLQDLFCQNRAAAHNLEKAFCWVRRLTMQYQQTNVMEEAILSVISDLTNKAKLFRLCSCLEALLQRSTSSYCMTESGRFGRCESQDVEPGDIVCMIPQGDRLHIFRPIEGRNTHRRITTAWFCGWSQGEAAALANSGELGWTSLKVE